MRGPNLIKSLIGVLIRFRNKLIALVGNVEAMFYHVFVKPEHANTLRFLWWPNKCIRETLDFYQMLVHIFGAKSSLSCGNLCLQQTTLHFAHLYDPTVPEIVCKSFYVNDCLFSVPSVEEVMSA